jgi:hypothetical protein
MSRPSGGSQQVPIKPYIVDDGGLEPYLLVWARTASGAKALVRRVHAPIVHGNYFTPDKVDPEWDAVVYQITLQAEPPAEPCLEERDDVLVQAAEHVRPA